MSKKQEEKEKRPSLFVTELAYFLSTMTTPPPSDIARRYYNIRQDVEECLELAACVCIDHSPGHIDAFGIWDMVNPTTGDYEHVLKMNNRYSLLSSKQVALLRAILIRYDEYKELKHSPEDERDRMTHKLRFQILSRDNYTCRICGAKPEPVEGNDTALYVDHIFPVSKGGKTQLGNLATLCGDCNIGKRDTVYLELIDPKYFLTPPEGKELSGLGYFGEYEEVNFSPVLPQEITPLPEIKLPSENGITLWDFLKWILMPLMEFIERKAKKE